MNYGLEIEKLEDKFNQEGTLMTLIPHGIKCDNPECDWNDMSINFGEYGDYINKPCPCCGENLLTEKCIKRVIRQMKTVAFVGDVVKKFTPKDVLARDTGVARMVTYDVDKDGRIVR